jgi:hypothetical protein
VSPVDYQNREHPVLRLNKKQADYLVNHVGLPLRFLPLPRRRRGFRGKLAGKLATWKSVFRGMIYRRRHLIPSEQLSIPEKRFILLLSRYLNSHPAESPTIAVSKTGFIRGRGILPGAILKDKHNLEPARLIIRRQHPLTKRAIQWIDRNPENIDFVAPLFQ